MMNFSRTWCDDYHSGTTYEYEEFDAESLDDALERTKKWLDTKYIADLHDLKVFPGRAVDVAMAPIIAARRRHDAEEKKKKEEEKERAMYQELHKKYGGG